MKTDAQIICRKTPDGVVCEWKGGRVAEVSHQLHAEMGWNRSPVFNYGGLTLRHVGLKWGTYTDYYLVMREGWKARLAWWTFRTFNRLIERAVSVDVKLYRWIGHPLHEGQTIPKKSLTYLVKQLEP